MTAEVEQGSPRAKLVGEVVIRELRGVKVNPWNANEMTPAEMESLKHGLVHDGWLVSQALLVWGTDETGAKRDVIIDGEHRWRGALAVGLERGPMVYLNGLTEAEARKLTLKLNQKRGHWNQEKLQEELRALDDLGVELHAIEIGFGEEDLMRYLSAPVVEVSSTGEAHQEGSAEPAAEGGAGSGVSPGPPADTALAAQTRMVQLFLDSTNQPQFLADCQALAVAWGCKTVTDTVLEAVRRERAALSEG